jgi:hypothetical protein
MSDNNTDKAERDPLAAGSEAQDAPKPKRRGRPPKTTTEASGSAPRKKRGRPPKSKSKRNEHEPEGAYDWRANVDRLVSGDAGSVRGAGVDAYWVGCTANSPIHTPDLGGISFPLSTQHVTDKVDGTTGRRESRGCIAYLTPEQVARVMEAGYRLMVRVPNAGSSARRHVVDSRYAFKNKDGQIRSRYRPHNSDHPLACYCYLIPWDERGQYISGMGPGNDPPTIEPLPEPIVSWMMSKPKEPERELLPV